MLAESTRQFDLYDFFSVLLPGATFVIGLAPFLPAGTTGNSLAFGLILLIVGFVIGRAIHAIGLQLERSIGSDHLINIPWIGFELFLEEDSLSTGHRDLFVDEIHGNGNLSKSMLDRFYNIGKSVHDDLDLPENRTEANERELEDLYTIVRTTVHMDSRGRSRAFQAVYDFHRTMLVTSLFLFMIYVTYDILSGFNLLDGLANYQSFIGVVNPIPGVISSGGGLILVAAFLTFQQVRPKYRFFFIQYLIADYIVLYTWTESEKQKPTSAS